jgi:IclR family transcriptional regulator, KDG regulon repressor
MSPGGLVRCLVGVYDSGMAKSSRRGRVRRASRKEPVRGDRSFLAVSERLFTTLETVTLFGNQEPTLDEITRRTGFPKSTTFRLLNSLEKCGYLLQNKGSGCYSLGPRFFDLANSSLPYQRLIAIAKPYFNALWLTFLESVNLGVLDEGRVAHILSLESPKPYRVSATVGNRAPLHCTSMGKALAAYLPQDALDKIFLKYGLPQHTRFTITNPADIIREFAEIRETGVSHDGQEDVEGVECFGAPIFGPNAMPIAAMSISGPSVRIGPQAQQIAPAVRETARRISIALGWVPPATASS